MKCYRCPDCGGELVCKNGSYYCKKCDELYEKKYVEKDRRNEDADY